MNDPNPNRMLDSVLEEQKRGKTKYEYLSTYIPQH